MTARRRPGVAELIGAAEARIARPGVAVGHGVEIEKLVDRHVVARVVHQGHLRRHADQVGGDEVGRRRVRAGDQVVAVGRHGTGARDLQVADDVVVELGGGAQSIHVAVQIARSVVAEDRVGDDLHGPPVLGDHIQPVGGGTGDRRVVDLGGRGRIDEESDVGPGADRVPEHRVGDDGVGSRGQLEVNVGAVAGLVADQADGVEMERPGTRERPDRALREVVLRVDVSQVQLGAAPHLGGDRTVDQVLEAGVFHGDHGRAAQVGVQRRPDVVDLASLLVLEQIVVERNVLTGHLRGVHRPAARRAGRDAADEGTAGDRQRPGVDDRGHVELERGRLERGGAHVLERSIVLVRRPDGGRVPGAGVDGGDLVEVVEELPLVVHGAGVADASRAAVPNRDTRHPQRVARRVEDAIAGGVEHVQDNLVERAAAAGVLQRRARHADRSVDLHEPARRRVAVDRHPVEVDGLVDVDPVHREGDHITRAGHLRQRQERPRPRSRAAGHSERGRHVPPLQRFQVELSVLHLAGGALTEPRAHTGPPPSTETLRHNRSSASLDGASSEHTHLRRKERV